MMVTSLSFEDATIPSELKALPHWVNWRAERNGERIEKIPVCAVTGSHASSTDPGTWADYATAAMNAMTADSLGLGFVFSKTASLVGIDLDKCRDATTGVLEPWAQEIVTELNSYTEVSPSGRGIHIFVSGGLPLGRRKKDRIEVYQHGRFFTVTGRHLEGTPVSVEARSGELIKFHARYFADPPTPERSAITKAKVPLSLSDEAILEKCRSAKNAAKFEALWRGDWNGYPSQSEGELALLGILRFYTQDASQLDRLFRQSGLMREKWDQRHGEQTYGQRSISEALKHVTETYERGSANGHAVSPSTMWGMSVHVSDEWPEIQPIKAELLKVDPLPLKLIPPAFREWVKDVSERMQCPPDYVAAPMLVMTGAVIGAGCGIRPKKHDDWTVIPNLWGGVVGRPSMLKTPAISEAMKPLETLEAEAKAAYDSAIKDHKADLKAYEAHQEALVADMRNVAKGKAGTNGHAVPTMDSLKYDYAHLVEPKPPVWRRYKTNDATIEKMAALQAENSRGLLLFRDELVGLLATWDKEDHQSDRAFYLEGFNGLNSYTADRIGRGHIYTPHNCVSLFGGIQPTKLTSYLYAAMRGHNNDGLVQRLQVLVYPDEPSTWKLIDTPINAKAKQVAYQAVQRLATMDFCQFGAYGDEDDRIPYFRFDEAGQAVFYQWWSDLEAKLRAQDDEPVVQEHLGKYRSLMPSLALSFHLLSLATEGQTAPRHVSQDCAELAAGWCDYFEQHARRIYGLVTNAASQGAARLALKLQQGALGDGFTARDVYIKDWSLLADRESAENACYQLVNLGWLREKVTPPAPGQRRKVGYLINPKVRPNGKVAS
jgi:hypothetical protein